MNYLKMNITEGCLNPTDIKVEIKNEDPLSSCNSEILIIQYVTKNDLEDTFMGTGFSSNSQYIIKEEPIAIENSDSHDSTSNTAITEDSYGGCLISGNSEKSFYECNKCLFSTKDMNEAVLHFVNNGMESTTTCHISYNEKGTFECQTCSFTTDSQSNAVDHWRDHVKVSLECFLCSLVTTSDDALKTHLMSHLNRKRMSNSIKSETGNKQETYCCVKCNFASTNSKDLNVHYYRMHGQKRFICFTCKMKFYYPRDIKMHVNKVHTIDQVYECLHCGTVVKHRSTFREHIQKHRADIIYERKKTELSDLQTQSKDPEINDKNSTKSKQHPFGPRTFSCSYCPFVGILKKYLKDHLQAEHSDIRSYLFCKHCSASFTSKRGLKRHIKVMHETELCKCPYCDFTTRHKQSLNIHLNDHEQEVKLLCDICGFQNSNKRNMELHIIKHGSPKNIFCNLCNFKTNSYSALNRHMDVHTLEKRFACDVCSYRSRQKEHLKRHKETHIEIKSFKCDICYHSFRNEVALTHHKIVHSTAREHFSCSICDKTYLSDAALKRHELSHSMKPFSCSVCSATLMSKLSLDTHMKLHTGEGRMYCFKCEYSSTHKPNFIAHVNKTCAKAKRVKEDFRYCYRCNYSSNHRTNFISHVTKGCPKLKLKLPIKCKT